MDDGERKNESGRHCVGRKENCLFDKGGRNRIMLMRLSLEKALGKIIGRIASGLLSVYNSPALLVPN